MKTKIKNLLKNRFVLFGIGLLILTSSIMAIYFYIGYTATISANVVGDVPISMIVVTPLIDFGILDFSLPETELIQIQEFIIESSDGANSKSYLVEFEVTQEELNPACLYTEDEVTFELWKTGGYGTIGEIFDGDSINTANNEMAGASTYELRLIAVGHEVCPVDYTFNLTFTEN